MAGDASNAALSPLEGELHDEYRPRRIRHITSIQIRNLTLFPARDALASALRQPSEQPQFTTHGHLSDDLDVSLGRKRGRRISMNSVHTLKSLKSEDGHEYENAGHNGVDTTGRKRAGSRISFQDLAHVPSSANTMRKSNTAGPVVRPGNRPRTTSVASSHSVLVPTQPISTAVGGLSTVASIPFSVVQPDHSQRTLEKIIKSRVIETFISITVPSRDATSPGESSPLARPVDILRHPAEDLPQSRSSLRNATSMKDKASHSSLKHPGTHSRSTTEGANIRTDVTSKTKTHVRSESSVSSVNNGTDAAQRKTGKPAPLRTKNKAALSSLQSPQRSPLYSQTSPSKPSASVDVGASLPSVTAVDYLSPIHKPSTNPVFPIDANPGGDFGAWTDLSANDLKVEVWGRFPSGWPGDEPKSASEKGKEKETYANGDDASWRILDQWSVNLADLVPFPDDLAKHPSRLPSNTLVISLSSPGQLFYLPPPPSSPRSASPSGGYNSDPESSLSHLRHRAQQPLPSEAGAVRSPSKKDRKWGSRRSRKDGSITAAWQDLVKLVTLQACIVDMKQSLSDVIQRIDKTVEDDTLTPMKREVSEREAWLEALNEEHQGLQQKSTELRSAVEIRRAELRHRREVLALAKEQITWEYLSEKDRDRSIIEEEQRLNILRHRIRPVRTALLTIVSSIYPIDLLSPPDLLYTILSVPLPIPLSPLDPAPPLSLSLHKEVSEDSVAAALGYAAQLVELTAAYVGRPLIYPVTCVGSRSLIRDGISAMVGPRMFPLFSRGVDTYRFEYGVFLLNKDIELLMAERDLRALDMRHTLPNLKNLLLTLTDGEAASISMARSSSPLSGMSGLQSPRAASPISTAGSGDTEISSASAASDESDSESPHSESPPGSGATTPTASVRQPRTFDLSSLTGFFRSRHPSLAKSGGRSASEASAGAREPSSAFEPQSPAAQSTSDDVVDDEEDRRTIRPASDNADAESLKNVPNGHASSEHKQRAAEGEKKVTDDVSKGSQSPHVLVTNAN